MANPSETPWSNNPNAPQVPSSLHLADKESFAGDVIGTILYGTLFLTSIHHLSTLSVQPIF